MIAATVRRRDPGQAPRAPRGGPVPWGRLAVLLVLILVPLSIPTSWTQDYIRLKRAGGVEQPSPPPAEPARSGG
jgi:hypothetical protein